jgi:hypothetical protein
MLLENRGQVGDWLLHVQSEDPWGRKLIPARFANPKIREKTCVSLEIDDKCQTNTSSKLMSCYRLVTWYLF